MLDLLGLLQIEARRTTGLVQRGQTRMAQGRMVHGEVSADRGSAYRAEVRLRRQIAVGAWTVILWGRADGVEEADGRLIVEEVKSTVLGAERLFAMTAADVPRWADQLRCYLWMSRDDPRDLHGRLLLVSLRDGSQHVIAVPPEHDRIDALVRRVGDDLVRERERRNAWLGDRQAIAVAEPYDAWRAGQPEIIRAVGESLARGERILVEAPTGLGKTGAILYEALRFALATGRRVFWATSRNSQQAVIEAGLGRLKRHGAPIRAITLRSRERACIHTAVDCANCPFAEGHHERMRERDVSERLLQAGGGGALRIAEIGRVEQVCPYELAHDAAERADLLIGDVNYALDPDSRIDAFEDPDGIVLVVDEVHQLPERARGWASPRVERAAVTAAISALQDEHAFMELAEHVLERIDEDIELADGPWIDGESVIEPSARLWGDLADRIDDLALDASELRWEDGEHPWLTAARQVLRLADALQNRTESRVAVARATEGAYVGILCLDASADVGPRIAALGGFIGASATISPPEYYRDVLGLEPWRFATLAVSSPFPRENREVIAVPRVSTAYKDRKDQAEPTAKLLSQLIAANPGNTAIFFSSFRMLADLAGRLDGGGRDLIVQRPALSDADRDAMLARLTAPRAVLLAVLGGVFAEGVDLPPGALSMVVIVGPGLPPVGLERRLLQAWHEERHGEGFRYASLVPGLTRVVQAAGRLHRRPEDRGVIALVDRRFRWRDVQQLLPEAWDVSIPEDPSAAVRAFFGID